ncbi:MAG: hypothetical protein JXA37_00280 [Chloroflexia bacterium]|nr:hypothetical protein [Chloroflexia bacterium]
MSEWHSPKNLQQARGLLDELYQEVVELESPLDGGESLSLGEGGSALRALRESKVSFGNPRNTLVRLTRETFAALDLPLLADYAVQMQQQFDFYYMSLNVQLWPQRGTQWSMLECSLDWGPKGEKEPIVQNYFPQRAWHEVLSWGGSMSLGLDGGLEWQAGLDLDQVPQIVWDKLPGEVRARLANKDEMRAWIAMPEFSFRLGRPEITAVGEGSSECRWRLENPDLQETQVVELGVVFKVPRGSEAVELTGLAVAEPKLNWLAGQLRNVFDLLSARLQDALKGKVPLPIGAHETWMLTLPNE